METWREQLYFETELYHHGIKGQKWGTRRFQNEDRTWTREGKLRYYTPVGRREFYNSKGVRLHGSKEAGHPTETRQKEQTSEEKVTAQKEHAARVVDSGKNRMKDVQTFKTEQWNMRFNSWTAQESTKEAINVGSQAVSLILTGGAT